MGLIHRERASTGTVKSRPRTGLVLSPAKQGSRFFTLRREARSITFKKCGTEGWRFSQTL